MTETDGHKIVLESYSDIPLCERWLFENKIAINHVKQGLEDVAANRISERVNFFDLMEDEIE